MDMLRYSTVFLFCLLAANAFAQGPKLAESHYQPFGFNPNVYDSLAYTWQGGKVAEQVEYIRISLNGKPVPYRRTTFDTAYSTLYNYDSVKKEWAPDSRQRVVYGVLKTLYFTEKWSAKDSSFHNYSQEQKYYSTADSANIDASYIWDGAYWKGVQRSLLRTGKKYLSVHEKWSDNTHDWMPLNRKMAYSGILTEGLITDEYDTVNLAWQHQEKDDTTYNADSSRDAETQYLWIGQKQDWVPWSQFKYQYDTGVHKTIKYGGDWDGSKYLYTSRYTTLSDSKGRKTFNEVASSGDGKKWTVLFSESFGYDAAGRQTAHSQSNFSQGTLSTGQLDSIYYNADGDTDHAIGYYLELSNGQWELSYRVLYSYKQKGFRTLMQDQNWDAASGWQNSNYILQEFDQYDRLTHYKDGFKNIINKEDRYYYDETAGIDPPAVSAGLTVYPNPAADQVRFVFSSGGQGAAMLSIFDVSGREVYDQPLKIIPGNNNFSWPVAHMDNGIYFYRLQAERGCFTGKIIVSH